MSWGANGDVRKFVVASREWDFASFQYSLVASLTSPGDTSSTMDKKNILP